MDRIHSQSPKRIVERERERERERKRKKNATGITAKFLVRRAGGAGDRASERERGGETRKELERGRKMEMEEGRWREMKGRQAARDTERARTTE